MTTKAKYRLCWAIILSLAVIFFMLPVASSLANDREESTGLKPGESNWIPPVFEQGAEAVITTTSLNVITPQQMVETLLNTTFPDPVISVRNIVYTGHNLAGGIFTGAFAPIGIPHGAILSTGKIASVVGGPAGACNQRSNTSTWWALPGDPDVSALSGWPTFDASVLIFEIKSTINQDIAFTYVFGSECYNEWVNTQFNDAFGLWIDPIPVPPARTNYALIPNLAAGLPVTINNVNNGNNITGPPVTNPGWYVNNHCNVFDLAGIPFPCGPPNRETELDGLTQHPWANPQSPPGPPIPVRSLVFSMTANVWYQVKIAIADASDHVWDSDVFIKTHFGVGSCCIENQGNYTCLDGFTLDACTALGGDWSVLPCIDAACGIDTGACCLPNGTCVILTEASCVAAGGIYAGDGTSCGPTGACCLDDGCQVMTQLCCQAAGGVFQVPGTVCSPQGACVVSPGICYLTLEECCNGIWLGAGTDCFSYGACCLPDGSCEEMTEADCELQNGEFQGGGVICQGDNNGNGIDDVCEDPHFEIPTLTGWGFIVLLILLAGAAVMVIRRRATAQ